MKKKASEERRAEREKIEERIRAGMTRVLKDSVMDKKDLATKVDEDPTSVGRWLKGPTTMPAWFVGKFCLALEVDARSLVGPDDGKEVELERRQALDETATLLRRISGELEKGRVPTKLS